MTVVTGVDLLLICFRQRRRRVLVGRSPSMIANSPPISLAPPLEVITVRTHSLCLLITDREQGKNDWESEFVTVIGMGLEVKLEL